MKDRNGTNREDRPVSRLSASQPALTAFLTALLWAGAPGIHPCEAENTATAAPPPAAEAHEDQLKAGQAALEDGLHAMALVHLEKYLENAGGIFADTPAMDLLFRALMAENRSDDILKRLGTRGGEDEKELPLCVYWRARACYELKRYGDALTALDAFDKRFPDADAVAPRVLRLKAWCLLATDNTAAALEAMAAFDARFGKTAYGTENLLAWGKALVAANQLQAATNVLGRLAAQAPDTNGTVVAEGKYWLAEVLARQGRDADAGRLFAALASDATATPELQVNALLALARTLEAATNRAEAVEALVRAEKLARTPELRNTARAERGRLLLDMKKLDEGIPILKAVIAESPGDPRSSRLQLKLAGALFDAGQYEEAAAQYQHHLETFTNSTDVAQAYRGRGWTLMNLGRYAEAATAFEKGHALFKEPENRQRCLFKAADAYTANRQFARAAETYRRFIGEFPASDLLPRAYLLLGDTLEHDGHTAEAEATLFELARKYAGTTEADDALVRIADMRRAHGQWAEALKLLNELVTDHTNSCRRTEAIAARGLVYYRLLDFPEALRDFNRLVEQYPDGALAEQARYMTGLCLYCLRRDKDAVDALTAFAAKYPNSPWAPHALFWLARHDFNGGELPEAEKRFLAVADTYPHHPLADDALLFAGWAASRRKEYVRAIELLSRLAKDYPESSKLMEGRLAQGEAMCELAQFSAAILVFDEIINKQGAGELVTRAWLRRGDCQFMLGSDDPKRYEDALRAYRFVSDDTHARADTALQARYKIGRCYEKMGREDKALDQYYTEVLVRFLDERDRAVWHSPASEMWFTKASFNAAEILERRDDWRGVVRILERIVEARVPAAEDTRARIAKIKSEKFWLFY